MTIFLKQSTASQEVPLGYFVDSTDGNTEETALTIANTDIKIWKTGATTLANKNSGGATHISNGVYYAVLDATDTDTLGPLVVFVHVAGALTVRLECCVLSANIYDSLIGGTDTLQTDVSQWLGTAAATPTTAGVPEVDTTHWNGVAVTTPPAVNATQISGDSVAADNLEAGFDGTGYAALFQSGALTEAYAADGAAATVAQLLYMIWSALAEFAISGTTITAKKLDGATTAMTFTLDSSTAPTSRTRAT